VPRAGFRSAVEWPLVSFLEGRSTGPKRTKLRKERPACGDIGAPVDGAAAASRRVLCNLRANAHLAHRLGEIARVS
jgi:hypothetical protein